MLKRRKGETMRIDRWVLVAVLACGRLLAPAPSGAANLVVNGGFDSDVSEWQSADAAELLLEWSSFDAVADDDSGSLRASIPGAPLNSIFLQCLDGVVAGQAYDFGARIGTLSGGAQGQAQLRVAWRAGTNSQCQGGTILGTDAVGFATAIDHFEDRSRSAVVAPPGTTSATIEGQLIKSLASPLAYTVFFDDIYFTRAGECHPDFTTLCLDDAPGDQRFAARVAFASTRSGGLSGNGTATSLREVGLRSGGVFWFFGSSNPEILVKVLNGCPVNGKYWVFFSAGTDIGFTLSVRDTMTGAVKTYSSPDFQASKPVQDTSAFACSP
jgi:hypothetical protein